LIGTPRPRTVRQRPIVAGDAHGEPGRSPTDDKEHLIKVELPEVQKDAVKVTVEGGTLTLAGS
jgi:hypothetical protein